MTKLFVNQLIAFDNDTVVARVLWLDPLGRGCYTINTRSEAALPVFRRAAELWALLEQGAARVVADDPWLAPASDEGFPDSHRRKRDHAWELIGPMMLDQPAVFETAARGQAIRRVVAEGRATKQTLYRMMRRYWQRGMTLNALLPDYAHCGAPGRDRKISEDHRRALAGGGAYHPVIDPDIRAIFRAVVTRAFAAHRHIDLRACYEEVILNDFSESVFDARAGKPVLVLKMPHPSLRQFRYWFDKDNDAFRIDRIRRATQPRGPVARAPGDAPGARWQIDAAIADVRLVSRFDRTRIVGRPVITLVTDVATRMITGVAIALDAPSRAGALLALANAAEAKEPFCHRFGIDIGAADWPCRGLPQTLLGDWGDAVAPLGITVENLPTVAPDWNSIVEQRFQMLPPSTDTELGERSGKDYRLDGVLDLDGFTKVVLHCILYYNNCLPPAPIERWEAGHGDALRSLPTELVRLALLPSDDATVTARGICFTGCYYTCVQAIDEGWFARAGDSGPWSVRISYDPQCMDHVFLHGEAGFVPCRLSEVSHPLQGKSLWEIDQLRQEIRQRGAEDFSHIDLGEAFTQAEAKSSRRARKAAPAAGPDIREVLRSLLTFS